LTAGPMPPSAAELLHVHFAELVERLRGLYDRIVIDCPPTLGFADAVMISSCSDATVLVVRAGKTSRLHVGGALRHLRGGRALIRGLVLNCVSSNLHSYYGYYQAYGAGYYADEQNRDDAAE